MNQKFRPIDLILYPLLFIALVWGIVAYTVFTLIICVVCGAFLLIDWMLKPRA
jgi:hypothetical protein